MNNNNKYKVEENFGEFVAGSKVLQEPEPKGNAIFGANPGNQEELPFDQERSPEIGEYSDPTTLRLDKMQSIIEAGLNKANLVNKRGDKIDPYINRQLDLSWKHLREAYLRLMDID